MRERIYQIDPSRESDHQREMHPSIELSDREHLERLGVKFGDEPTYVKFNKGPKYDDTPLQVSKEMEQEGWVYREPPPEEAMSPDLKEKFELAKKLTKETKVIDLRGKDAKSKSKGSKTKAKKTNTKSHKPTMASIQS